MLCCALSRLLKQKENEISITKASSHVNFRYLNTPEKTERLQNLSRLLRVKEREIQALRIRLVKVTTANGITVSEGIHQDLLQIMNLHNNQHSTDSNSFASIFWNQQLKAATLKDTRQMRWHHDTVVLVFAPPLKWSLFHFT